MFLEANGYELRVPDHKLTRLARAIGASKGNAIPVERIARTLAKYTRPAKVESSRWTLVRYYTQAMEWLTANPGADEIERD